MLYRMAAWAVFISLYCCIAWAETSPAPAVANQPESCAACHQSEFKQWQASQHAAAMQVASEQTVLGAFDGQSLEHQGLRYRFLKDGGRFWITLNEPEQALRRLEARYTFGVYPLQQYLVAMSGGRMQALPIAWDSRSKAEGGQRWYGLDSDLGWDHYAFTWNTSCAECHSTGLEKGYSPEQNRFDTHWQFINVSCQACHGDASGHGQWLKGKQPSSIAHGGFSATLAERGTWHFSEGATIAQRRDRPAGRQLSACGQCHSLGTRIDNWQLDSQLADHLSLMLPNTPLYHLDGQIDAEVFVVGSFMQSKMHDAGVVCSDCHNPHSLALKVEGNALCAQCHLPSNYNQRQHHGHAENSSGAQCVNCHMPSKLYMGVDARRDHRFGIPSHALSEAIGVPNVCSQCHEDKGADWLRAQTLGSNPDVNDVAMWLSELDRGALASLPKLLEYVTDPQGLTFRQASVMAGVGARIDDPALSELARQQMQSGDPALQGAAVEILERLPLEERLPILLPYLDSQSKSVRIAVTRALAEALSSGSLKGEPRKRLSLYVDEYRQSLLRNADHPASQMALGNLSLSLGKIELAEQAYRQALRIDATYAPASINLADLHRQRGDEGQAQTVLLSARTLNDDAAISYALSMSYFRQRKLDDGLKAIIHAVELAPMNSNYAYAQAVALEQSGQPQAAIAALEHALQRQGSRRELLELLSLYAVNYQSPRQALPYVLRWRKLVPNNPRAAAIEQRLRWQLGQTAQ